MIIEPQIVSITEQAVEAQTDPYSFSFTVSGSVHQGMIARGVSTRRITNAFHALFVKVTNSDGTPFNEQASRFSVAGLETDSIDEADLALLSDRIKKALPEFILYESSQFIESITEHFKLEREADGPPGPRPAKRKIDSRRRIIQQHLEYTEELLNVLLDAPPTIKKNKRGLWTKAELSRAVWESTNALPQKEWTFPKVAEMMKQRDPDRAPASGEALRKLCNRYEVKADGIRRRDGKRKKREEADIK
jgi:hypothetical protein